MSFWLDWWLLLVGGIFIVLICKGLPKIGLFKNRYNNYWLKRLLMIMFLSGFYLISIGFWVGFSDRSTIFGAVTQAVFDLMKWFYAPYFVLHPAATSTEFMYSSGQEWLRVLLNLEFNDMAGLAQHPVYMFFGICVFSLYPLILYCGVTLGELLFGSSPGKKGLFGIGWFLVMIVLIIVTPIITYFTVQNSILSESFGGPLIPALIVGFIVAVFFILDFLIIQRKK
jgi:hypothetical protein